MFRSLAFSVVVFVVVVVSLIAAAAVFVVVLVAAVAFAVVEHYHSQILASLAELDQENPIDLMQVIV